LYFGGKGEVSFSLNSGEIRVHEDLLMNQSSNFEESKTKCIDMQFYHGKIVQDFVKFLYLEESPDFNYYLSRPELLFSAIEFCRQFAKPGTSDKLSENIFKYVHFMVTNYDCIKKYNPNVEELVWKTTFYK
jgi:hypothetical protein